MTKKLTLKEKWEDNISLKEDKNSEYRQIYKSAF